MQRHKLNFMQKTFCAPVNNFFFSSLVWNVIFSLQHRSDNNFLPPYLEKLFSNKKCFEHREKIHLTSRKKIIYRKVNEFIMWIVLNCQKD